MSISTHQQTPDIRLLGHWLYLKKCLDSDILNSKGEILIVLPDHRKDYAELLYAWFEVIAKGPQVGQAVPKGGCYWQERKTRGFPNKVQDAFEVGDRIMIQCEPWRFEHSPYATRGEQIFLDETVPIIACDANDNVRMLQDFVLLDLVAEKHEGGISEPDEAYHDSRKATVVMVSAGERDLAVGNVVLIPDVQIKRQLTIKGKTYELVRSKEILAVIEDAA